MLSSMHSEVFFISGRAKKSLGAELRQRLRDSFYNAANAKKFIAVVAARYILASYVFYLYIQVTVPITPKPLRHKYLTHPVRRSIVLKCSSQRRIRSVDSGIVVHPAQALSPLPQLAWHHWMPCTQPPTDIPRLPVYIACLITA